MSHIKTFSLSTTPQTWYMIAYRVAAASLWPVDAPTGQLVITKAWYEMAGTCKNCSLTGRCTRSQGDDDADESLSKCRWQ